MAIFFLYSYPSSFGRPLRPYIIYDTRAHDTQQVRNYINATTGFYVLRPENRVIFVAAASRWSVLLLLYIMHAGGMTEVTVPPGRGALFCRDIARRTRTTIIL